MLRVKDPKISLEFYKSNFGMELIDTFDSPERKLTLYFIATLPEERTYDPLTGKLIFKGTVLELHHSHGTENDADFKYQTGNEEPFLGFGHVGFYVDNLSAACEVLETNGVKFEEKYSTEKSSLFIQDPDGYRIEIMRRGDNSPIKGFSLAKTMIRVKDATRSLQFYRDYCEMTLLSETHSSDGKISSYILASLKPGEELLSLNERFNPVLELTHIHGTENDTTFSYHDGNSDPKGFGHLGFFVDDPFVSCDKFDAGNYQFIKKPTEGVIKGLAFVRDPDGYWVEIIPRGFKAVTK